ncbi:MULTISPECIES: hypothetical protein [unclassified Clostridioides]|uniref:hypothetical protein n=1 Tax=unclassified Clostridioides TaxID=2635829 RepID=UPI001D12DFD9|nr:hypothetical protein [Clostridioides sp. ES-S-0001-02]MCC0638981.1 hypothetical protein [Clostridioides sp. ES-S-0049-03]MCC0657292.1 hypothetical protein [Clostridioides sp. ES-S-0123-01]MCC0672697.1 hypothetical protein [Clostridioides sp. ES-S-0145-01]MCC0675371.1 hypothetical protein [Clostridioides sp. ES-W-0018-02]MCC0679987.1 hypothetical protein [Clostridioides sp. ES-S-0005-03]MCC0709820.1 hypothetical protein [Clostridioides sp. ES-W-0017-02]UDN46222.1 hypothetical protein JJJ25
MAVKQKNIKKKDKEELYSKAVKIKCCYCSKKEDCLYQARKEFSESIGHITYCTLTPNIPKKQRKKIKR